MKKEKNNILIRKLTGNLKNRMIEAENTIFRLKNEVEDQDEIKNMSFCFLKAQKRGIQEIWDIIKYQIFIDIKGEESQVNGIGQILKMIIEENFYTGTRSRDNSRKDQKLRNITQPMTTKTINI